ncbi:hypothetical protein ACSSS7_002956 [Eimeria intestinalis]
MVALVNQSATLDFLSPALKLMLMLHLRLTLTLTLTLALSLSLRLSLNLNLSQGLRLPPSYLLTVGQQQLLPPLQQKQPLLMLRFGTNVEPPSLSFKSFLAKQDKAEVVIPSEAVYQAATEYLSRNPLDTLAPFTFGIAVTDAMGFTSTGLPPVALFTAKIKVNIALTLEPPGLLSDSPATSNISKDQTLDFVVTPQYCPHVATEYDSGIAFQWSVTCPNDVRTADQLLRLSNDGRTASVRPFSLTPGYTYTVSVALRYTSNPSLTTSKSFTVTVETETIHIRFQYIISKRETGEEELVPEMPE